jgi:hypothetical protein
MSNFTLRAGVAAAVVLALGFALNPSPQKHRSEIESVTGQRSPIAGALGLGALTAFASNYHSLGVASYTTVGERIVSIGAFGMVFLRQ